MGKAKPYEISKHSVMEAFRRVKANAGGAGIDEQSIAEFELELKDNLYKVWNRMSSGSYFPPPVRACAIPKKSGGERILGIPTVSDRVAQTVVKMHLEPLLEPHFHPDSYGFRPGKSAHQALAVTRQRCWRADWVVEFDIKGLFDNIDHELLMRALRKHTDCAWVLLYVERWLKAPLQHADGTTLARTRGTPQGGVVSPLLANLFLHYVFDSWMVREFRHVPFCRYADDGLAHCRNKRQADYLRDRLEKRFRECRLELHPLKTKVIYCKDELRKGEAEHTSFDFLGYTFRPRLSYSQKNDKHFVNFSPAVSKVAQKAMRDEVWDWKLRMRADKNLEDLSAMFNPVIRGWMNYYGKFYPSEMYSTLRHLNRTLVKWAMRKYKRLRRHQRRAEHWLGRIAKKERHLFAHWKLGILPTAD